MPLRAYTREDCALPKLHQMPQRNTMDKEWDRSSNITSTIPVKYSVSKTTILGRHLPDPILEELECARRNVSPVHCIYLRRLEYRHRRGQGLLHCPDCKGAHIYQWSVVAINRPCFWSLEPVPELVQGNWLLIISTIGWILQLHLCYNLRNKLMTVHWVQDSVIVKELHLLPGITIAVLGETRGQLCWALCSH